jgi:hypothetical protein
MYPDEANSNANISNCQLVRTRSSRPIHAALIHAAEAKLFSLRARRQSTSRKHAAPAQISLPLIGSPAAPHFQAEGRRP